MPHRIVIASTPHEAYTKAQQRYGIHFRVLSARQIALEGTDETICELLVDVPQPSPSDEVRDIFIQRGIDGAWLDTTVGSDETILHDKEKLTAYLLSSIYENIHESQELEDQKIMMFVGPTGVGKTTNIAKLASRYAREFEQKVVLLNLDRLKKGAKEQLALHANDLNLTHIAIESIGDFVRVLREVEEYDRVLIDSAGFSPFDIEQMMSNIEYILASHQQKMHITLVLSALSKEEDLEDIYQNFSFLDLDALLISKFDETRHIGNVINFLIRHNTTPLSYISIGQTIPNDILCECKRYILDKFVGTL